MEFASKIAQVPLDTFMDEFVPGPDIPPNSTTASLNRGALGCDQRICDELCRVAKSVLEGATRHAGISLIKTKSIHCCGDNTDTMHRSCTRRPDCVALYFDNDEVGRAYSIQTLALADTPEDAKDASRDEEAETAWLRVSLLMDVTSDENACPFVVPKSNQAANIQPSSLRRREARASSDSTTDALPTSPPSDRLVPPAPARDSLGAEPNADVCPKILRLDARKGVRTMERMADHVCKVLQKQFVLFFFTIFVCCDRAWLLRWDRAGVVVSEPFNFLDQPRLLHRFLYRFACLDDAQRGRDLTVCLASNQELELVRSFNGPLTDWQRAQFKAAFSDYPVYRVDVPQDDMISAADLRAGAKVLRNKSSSSDVQDRQFLIGKPYFTGNSIVGRATRGHIAFDVSGNRLVFCKEYWRLDRPSHHPEGETLMLLHSKGVEYIATPIVAGDAFRQRRGAKYIQYRVIVLEVGEPLKNYADSYELVGVMYDAVTAHEQAWKLGHTLHRDISVNNILIYRYYDSAGNLVVKALLIDWGLCKFLEELAQMASQDTRSGTWQFISAVLLMYPGRFKYEVWHDLESFIHVLHWMCFRFQKTNVSYRPALFSECVRELYDACKPENGNTIGGRNKLKFLLAGIVPFELQGGSSTHSDMDNGLHQLLTALASLYGKHYKLLEPKLKLAETVAPAEGGPIRTKDKWRAEKSKRVTALSKQLLPRRSTPHDTATPRGTTTPHEGATPRETTASPEPDMVASPFTHDEILAAFSAVMDSGSWVDDPKQSDQFEKTREALRKEAFGSHWTRGSKRSSDDSWEAGSLAKRSRASGDDVRSAVATGTPQLGSVSEGVEHSAYEG
ncbi:hypothetical protein FOMPIDRAFT_84469 [Fomitopsis schrenkii]|uniref:Fungal-type protein kinase domain-containing protein n=1 Tax=Fomitopsis schrenkii TaxID=2126942 RepID=S8F5T3_FOMSC|nr:hypothetical protein FOMPIDRAFT_84469 [Fomitopsis schrenkii]